MTIESQGVVIAAILFGFGIGLWAAMVTWQLRSLKRGLAGVHGELAYILGLLEAILPAGFVKRDGVDRHPPGVLGPDRVRVRGVRRPVE